MGRVCWGMGMGWIYLTLAIPVPLVWVAGYLPSWWWVFAAEFELKSTIDLTVPPLPQHPSGLNKHGRTFLKISCMFVILLPYVF